MKSYKFPLCIVTASLLFIGCNDQDHSTRKFASDKKFSIDTGSSEDATGQYGEEEVENPSMGSGNESEEEELMGRGVDEANTTRSLEGVDTGGAPENTTAMTETEFIPIVSVNELKADVGSPADTIRMATTETTTTPETAERMETEVTSEIKPDGSTTASVTKTATVAEQVKKEACEAAVPIYRWYQPSTGNHFYTPHASKECVGKNKSHPACNGETVNEAKYQFEKIEFWVQTRKSDLTQEVHRFMNRTTGDHIYSIGEKEIPVLIESEYFRHEAGGNFYTFTKAYGTAKPIFRWLRNPQGPVQDHMYTVSADKECVNKPNPQQACGEDLSKKDNYEGIIGYGFASKPVCPN